METRHVGMRIPPELVEAARRSVGSDVSLSVLVRAALIKLADPDLKVREAVERARTRPGPKSGYVPPQEHRDRISASMRNRGAGGRA